MLRRRFGKIALISSFLPIKKILSETYKPISLEEFLENDFKKTLHNKCKQHNITIPDKVEEICFDSVYYEKSGRLEYYWLNKTKNGFLYAGMNFYSQKELKSKFQAVDRQRFICAVNHLNNKFT